MRGRKGDDSKKITIKIVSKSLPVRHEASRMGSILCQIQKGFIVQYSSEAIVEDILWVHISSGWICSKDTNGWPSFEIVPVQEGNNFWAKEYDNRKRISAAIGAMLTRSYSLMEARRFTKLLLNQCSSFQKNYNPLTGLPDVSLDDLLVGINASVGLKPREVFEFIKITASQQSNPHKCLNDMCTELFEMLDMRPTLWIKNNLGILTTTDLKQRNDTFVMAAAKNDVAAIERFLEEGQELSVLHSSLDYTALHAAADFGAYDAIVKLLSTGLSVNIKDAKYGQTPLHFAAQSGRSQIASLLLEKNADRTIANFDGVLPFEIAHEQGHFPCREILKFPPPEIQHAVIVDCTHNTITVAWTPPTLKERLHSDIINYMVEWVPLENDKYGHGQQFETTETTFTVNNLHPASGHSFVFYSRSVSGVSKQSTCMLIHFTDSCTPDAPEPIELIKTTKNGLLLNWCDPDSDNGAKITLWELELIDYGSLVSLGVCTAKAGQKRDLSVADNVSVEESTTAQSNEHSAALDDDVVDLDSMEEGQDEKEEMEEPPKRMHDNTPAMTGHRIMLEEKQVVEKNRVKYHRSIIHRNLNVLRKFVMGLAPGCQYGCRVRAENEVLLVIVFSFITVHVIHFVVCNL